ncbi:tripartite tricarboxylate transporter permease [Thalassospira sp. MCCC 1A01428]|uniref:tripartite tricarboxylate transporter permease n=1 Tax=Thalassospira sp. MCCC 1A01428 TaxID=1470575 RepID=UPI000A1E9118|nr:tripartite tricarboxylate transporter permease [Thalassospira sp. MCCC 1A01428]OSQ46308.1 C4-dicarboxylate ABC transporter permease [Thalassospira sp. MCCC 1A01428]
MDVFYSALEQVLRPDVLLIILGSSIYGIVIGAIPGLTATMGTALLVPLTFFMDPVPAIGAIVSATTMAIFAGDIPGALLRIPGTPASAAYTDEAYKMREKGLVELALGTNVICSMIGGLVGVLVLVLAAPQIAEFSLMFSSYEYFWLAVLGLSCAIMVSRGSAIKSTLSLTIGLMLSMIGIDVVMGIKRFTFGDTELVGGISIIPTLIGMFAITEILRKIGELRELPSVPPVHISRMMSGVGSAIWKYKGGVARSSILGTMIGALPGAGADIAAWVSYAVSKKFSKTPEKYGEGHIEGIISASSANNAALSGAYVPTLVFGIPGDTITAILIGVLLMKGITPGPMVFVMDAGLVNAIFMVFVLANVIMVPIGIGAVLMSRHVLGIPQAILFPIILLFCVIGAYAANNTLFDVWVMLVVGLVAYVLEENDFPLAPMILALILGPLIEENFMKSMIKADGHLIEFFSRPVSGTLGVITLAIWAVMTVMHLRHAKRKHAASLPS